MKGDTGLWPKDVDIKAASVNSCYTYLIEQGPGYNTSIQFVLELMYQLLHY